MKKALSIVLALATLLLSLSAFSVLAQEISYDGAYDTLENQLLNSAATEYYIEDADDYKIFIRELERAGESLQNTSGTAEAAALIYVTGNGAFAGKTVYLASDIVVDRGLDADESMDFGSNDEYSIASKPDAIKGFSGTFDGRGHTVSGVCLVSEVASGGSLFGYATGNVAVRNVTFENCYLQSKNPGLAALFTSVANDATCTVENVDIASDFVLFSLRDTNMSGYVGGLIGNVGAATVTVKNSTFGGKIMLREDITANYVGGLVGCVMNHQKALASPILEMDSCGFFGEIVWNNGSLAVSKFIGALCAPLGDALSLPIRVSAKNCIIAGKITRGDALLIGGYQGASSGTSIKLGLENTVWTAEDRLPDLGPKMGMTSTGCIVKNIDRSGFLATVDSQALLSGDVLDKDAVPTGQKYDLSTTWVCVSETPAPLGLLGSKNAGQGTRLEKDGTCFAGYQAKMGADGHSLRFVSVGNDTEYDRVGVSVMLDKLRFDQSTDKVYYSITSADGPISATLLGGTYVYTAECSLPADSGEVSGVVVTWHEKHGQKYYDSVRALKIDASCVITEALRLTPEYKIYAHAGLSDFDDELSAAIKAKTGMALQTALTPSGKRIILGTADDFAGVQGMREPSYTSYLIKVIEDDVYIAVGTDIAPDGIKMTAQTAIDAFARAIKMQGGEILVGAELDMFGDLALIGETVPTLSGRTPSMIFACGADNYQAKYEGVDNASVMAGYEGTLRSAGYTLYTNNEINGNKFATYKKGDTHVKLSYFPYYSLFHVSYGLDDLALPTSPVTGYAHKATPTLSMLQLTETGLSMVAQLADGSFVIIDGGTRSADNNYGKLNKQLLWDFLQSKLPTGESKPRITWILTHAHNDHVTLPNSVLRERCDEIILERVIYNFPNMNDTRVKAINQTLAYYYPDTPIWTPHSGDLLYLPGAKIEFLLTHEDRSGEPSDGDSVNNSSLVFRVTMEGKTCMVFADAMEKASTYLYNLYGSTLKSDIMQVPHHGAGTASWEVYSATDPSICLWSVGRYKFDNDVRMLGTRAGMDYNAKLRDPAHGARAHYTLSETVTINMNTLEVSVSVHGATCDALLAEDKATVQKK